MSRLVAWSLAFCLCCFAEQASAQGLLGKPNVSAQYLLFRAGDIVDPLDSDLGHGGRVQGSIPLVLPDSEATWGFGLDGFGAFSGLGFDAHDPSDPSMSADFDVFGGDLGAIFYTRATENIRPFAMVGINWSSIEAQIAGGPTFKETDTSVIITGGVEVDVLPFAAVRASYGRGADGFGGGFASAFLGEVIVRPGDHWFGRFSASVDHDKTVIGGFGAGFAW